MDEIFVAIPVEEIHLDLEPDRTGVEDELDERWVLNSSAETVAAAPAFVPAEAVGTAFGLAGVEIAVVGTVADAAVVDGTVADGKAAVETTAVVEGAGAVLEAGAVVASRPDGVEAVVHSPVELAAGSAQAVGTVERAGRTAVVACIVDFDGPDDADHEGVAHQELWFCIAERNCRCLLEQCWNCLLLSLDLD